MIHISAHGKAVKKVCHVYLRYKTVQLILQSIRSGKYLPHGEMFMADNSFRQKCRQKTCQDILESLQNLLNY